MTTSDPATSDPAAIEAQVASTGPARLADATARELAHLARFQPETLEGVYPELRALAAALVGASANGEAGEPVEFPVAPSSAGDRPAPAAEVTILEMSGARSLMHAVHLASYRREDMARRGWTELRAAHSMLADLDARLELAHIPDQGDFLRLKAGPLDSADGARALCRELEAAGRYCRAVDFTGRPLTDR